MARPQNGVNGNIQQQHFGYIHGFNINNQIPRNQNQNVFGYSDIQQVVSNHYVPQVYSTSINQNVTNNIRPASPMIGQTQYTIYQYPPTYPQQSHMNQFQFQTNFNQHQQYAYTQETSTVPVTYPTTRQYKPLVVIDPANNTDLDLSKYQSLTNTDNKIISDILEPDLVNENVKEKMKSTDVNDIKLIIEKSEGNVESVCLDIENVKEIDLKDKINENETTTIEATIENIDLEEDCITQRSNAEEEDNTLMTDRNPQNYFLQINKKESDETTLRKKLIYDREYLVSIKSNSLCQRKPANLPSTYHFSEEIIYNESRNISCKKPITSQSTLNNTIKRQISKSQGNCLKKNTQYHQFQPKLINLDNYESQVFERLKSSYLPPQLRCKDKDVDPYLELKRNIKCNLNKITPQNFEECLSDINKLNIKEKEEMTCLINEIFNKAVQEEAYSVTYAQFCNKLAHIHTDNHSFKSQLLKKCQDMFQTPIQDQLDNVRKEWMLKIDNESEPKMKSLYASDLEEQVKKAKDRYFGNIRFIGELFLHNLLAGKVIINCIGELLKGKSDSDALLALCKLLETCGKQIDKRSTDEMNKFITNMDNLSKSNDLETRIRFKLKDIVDMRKRKWTLRHIQQEKKINPKTLEEQKEEAVAEAALAALKLAEFQSTNNKSYQNIQHNLIRRQVSAPQRPIAFKNLSCSSHVVDDKTILGPVKSNWIAGSGYKSKQRNVEGWNPMPQKSAIMTRSREPSPQVKLSNKYRTLESSAECSGADSRPNSPPIICPSNLIKAYRIPKENKPLMSDEERADIIFNDLLIKGVFNAASWVEIRNYKVVFEKWIDDMMEKDASFRRSIGDSFNKLIQKKIITYEDVTEGCQAFISSIDDLIYDIPKLWEFFSQFIEPFIADKNSNISFFMNIFKPLLPNKYVALCISLALHAASSRLGHNIVGYVFRNSSLKWEKIIPNNWEEFVEENQLNFTLESVAFSTSLVGASLLSISTELEILLSKDVSNENIFDYFEKHIDKATWKSIECTRTLTTCILKAMKGMPVNLVKSYLIDKSKIIKQISQNKIDNEIEILKAILYSANELNKEILTIIYDVIMTEKILSNKAFDHYLEDVTCKSEAKFDLTFQLISQMYKCG